MHIFVSLVLDRSVLLWGRHNYLQGEYDFDGGYFEMRGEADRLRPLIRETLVEELIDNPEMSAEKIRECIEDLIDDGL